MKERLEKMLKTYMEEFHYPSAALGIIKGGEKEIITLGKRDLEKNLPMEKDTIYAVGSQTKAFTALGLAILLKEKNLSFDNLLKDLYDGFKMEDDYLTDHLTLRDGLSHRTGFPKHLSAWYNNNFKEPREFLKILGHLPATMPLRYEFCYQSYFFIMGGLIIESLSGKSFGDFLKERIFDKLGMKNTFVLGSYAPDENKARPYQFKDGKFSEMAYNYEFTKYPNGSGTIYSTMEDMLKWLDFWVNGNEDVASKETYLEVLQANTIIREDKNALNIPYVSNRTYAMGWFRETYRGMQIAQHLGAVDGFKTHHIFLPEKNIGISLAVNLNEAGGSELICYSILDELLGLEKDWQDDYLKALKNGGQKSEDHEKFESLKENNFEKYEGLYSHPGYGEFKFFQKAGKLFVHCFNHDIEVLEKGGQKYIDFKAYNLSLPMDFKNGNLILEAEGRKVEIKKIK